MKNPEVFIRSECPACGGMGRLPSPKWSVYHNNPHATKKSEEPEVIPCEQCAGSGYEIKWIPLEELESEAIVGLTKRLDALEKTIRDADLVNLVRGRE